MQSFLKLIVFYFLINTLPCLAGDLWVDTLQGSDNQDGLTPATAVRTIQAAATLATPGTTVHIQPGIYRETIYPAYSGTLEAPIIYRAEQGLGSVIIRGSESASHLVWTPLTSNNIGLPASIKPSNIVWTDLSAWNLTQLPRFVMQLDASGKVLVRLQPAREPDWTIQTEWKYHEFWWSAEGGTVAANCDPLTDKNPQQCDSASRSLIQLTDLHDDNISSGVEAGNLTTLGNLTGATLVVMDALQGHFTYRRTIVNHEINIGRITLDQEAQYNTLDNPSLGWGSQYYLENHPALLDNPGEYWFDAATNRLYLWPLTTDLSQLEISQRDSGWDLSNLSYLTLDGLVLEFFNDKAIVINNGAGQSCHGNQLQRLQVRYANHGLFAEQMLTTHSPFTSVISELVIADSEFGYLDTRGLSLLITRDNQTDDTTWFTYAPIVNIVINHNEFHHLGFRSQYPRGIGILFDFADHLHFEANHVHHVAHDGVVFSNSIIQADKTFDFTPAEIKTGDILVKNNLIEHTCQNADDCGGITFSGTAPQHHVFRNVLVMDNTFRYIYGWSFVSQQRKRWANGYFGFGLYLLDVSGIHVYRNLAYNNGWAGIFLLGHWRDGPMMLYNNLLANSTIGINIWNAKEIETHDSVDTQLMNNILINNEYHGINLTANSQDTHLGIDHNLYYANSWGSGYGVGNMKVYQKSYLWFEDIQAQTGWEPNGISADPLLFSYDYRAQRQRGDDSVLDLEIMQGSATIDKGTASLPPSLLMLLERFNIQDNPQQGSAWDIGPFEYLESHQPLFNLGTATAIATQQPQDTQAQFMGLVTTGFVTNSLDQRGNHLILAQSDKAKVMAEIHLAPDDIEQLGQLGMVAAYTPPGINQPIYFMRQGTQWISWDENLSTLVPAQIENNLPLQFKLFSPIKMIVYEGRLQNLPGHFTIYVGYILSNGLVVFNGQQPIEFTVQ
ncbi:MAG: right-handed parallel beta-helix repeat-containing protein [Thioploca sp.]|nr:right-handed parallel beta-helix repeat-containing protein [Thioploca sp.]